MSRITTTAVDYSDISYAAAFRDAPEEVQAAIIGSWPIGEWGNCAAIIMRESGNNIFAKKEDTVENSYGLMQINRNAHPQYMADDLLDPVYNCRAGYEIYQAAGYSWRPWSTAPALGLH